MSRSWSLRLILVALAVLGVGWLLAPHSAPPIYDGIGNPDDPYRFVVPPTDAVSTPAPSIATSSASVQSGTAGGIQAASFEQAPQVTIAIPAGRLHAPGMQRITVTARPVQPLPAPNGAYLWSNVYAVSATPGTTLRTGSPPATITLRAATAQQPRPTIEHYVRNNWKPLKTIAVGRDVYQAPLPALGKYAVVGTTKLKLSNGSGNGSTTKTGIVIGAGALIVLIVLIVFGQQRRLRARARQAEFAATGRDRAGT